MTWLPAELLADVGLDGVVGEIADGDPVGGTALEERDVLMSSITSTALELSESMEMLSNCTDLSSSSSSSSSLSESLMRCGGTQTGGAMGLTGNRGLYAL